jgi:hypothetical protein
MKRIALETFPGELRGSRMEQIKDELRARGRQAARLAAHVLGGLVLIGLALGPALSQPRPDPAKGGTGGAPLLLVTETEIDLGDLPKGSSADARFELRNAGNADLVVREVRTGCSCAVAEYDEVIKPGEVGYVTATLSTETLNGRVAQGVSLMTNDPGSPATYLLVRAQVVTAVRILPEKQIVLRGTEGEPPVLRVVRRSADSGHGFFNIVGLRTSEPWISARASKVREAAPASGELPAVAPGDWILEVGLSGMPPFGKRREQVEFKTGLDRQPQVSLEVHTNRRAPVRMATERLVLPSRPGAVEEELSFTVRNDLDPSGLRADASPEGLTVQLEPGSGQTMTARVRWKGGELADGVVAFRVDGELFELPVTSGP